MYLLKKMIINGDMFFCLVFKEWVIFVKVFVVEFELKYFKIMVMYIFVLF